MPMCNFHVQSGLHRTSIRDLVQICSARDGVAANILRAVILIACGKPIYESCNERRRYRCSMLQILQDYLLLLYRTQNPF